MVAVSTLVVVAVLVAFALGRGTGDSAEVPEVGTTEGAEPTRPQPVPIADVVDFDPLGDTNEENPELADLAVDGDPSTAWSTLTYYNDPRLGLLKDGVGLLVDLGAPAEVRRVDLALVGTPTDLEILAARGAGGIPRSVDGLRRVAAVKGAGTDVRLRLDPAVTTRYLVVWLTSLPAVPDGFAGQVAEIRVLS